MVAARSIAKTSVAESPFQSQWLAQGEQISVRLFSVAIESAKKNQLVGINRRHGGIITRRKYLIVCDGQQLPGHAVLSTDQISDVDALKRVQAVWRAPATADVAKVAHATATVS